MKKITLILAVVLVGLSATAQEAKNERRGQRRPQPEQMAQMATRQMAERYSLTADQVKAVADLNRQYAGKVPMHFGFENDRGRGPQARGGRLPQGQNGEQPHAQNGQRPQRSEQPQAQNGGRPQSQAGERPQLGGQPQAQHGGRPDFSDGHRPQRQELTKEQQKQLKKDRKAYTKGLKKIMDKTQFKAYQKDLAEMEEAAQNRPAGGPGHGFGPGSGGSGMDRSSAPAEGFRSNPGPGSGSGLGPGSGPAGLGGPEI